jgi:hypothetical protein
MNADHFSAEIEQELIVIGAHVLATHGGLSARPPTAEDKRVAALQALRRAVCPHRERIHAVIQGLPTQIAITMIDVIIHVALNIFVPPLKIAELICTLGVHNFCRDYKQEIND